MKEVHDVAPSHFLVYLAARWPLFFQCDGTSLFSIMLTKYPRSCRERQRLPKNLASRHSSCGTSQGHSTEDMWSRRAAEQAASDGTNASTDGKGALPSAFGPQVDTTANWQSLNPFNTLKGLTWPQGASRILLNLFPAAVWLPRYRVRDCLRSDMVAGITVGAMLIPQGMSYALIAGLPPVYG